MLHAKKDDIIFDTDPARLVKTIVAKLDREYADFIDEIKSLEQRPKKSLRG